MKQEDIREALGETRGLYLCPCEAKELFMAHDELRPAVYVGTYGKYNEGSIYGAWLNPGDYDTYEDFMKACGELHKDEPSGQREFMFQDYENLPRNLYSESYFSKAAFAYCKAYDEAADPDALEAYAELFEIEEDWDADDIFEDFNEKYRGEYEGYTDLAYAMVDELGLLNDMPSTLQNYFDYEAYGRDLMFDFDECNGHYFWRY